MPNLVTRPGDSIDEQNVPGFLYCVMRADALLSGPASTPAILARFNSIKTRADAAQYISEVLPKVSAARNALSTGGSSAST